MKMRNRFWLIAGALCAFTAFVHLIAGQLDLVNPLMSSQLSNQATTEWLAAWHTISVLLVGSAGLLLFYGRQAHRAAAQPICILLGWGYVLFALVFIGVGLVQATFAPQWILLLPIGVLALIGAKRWQPLAAS